MRKLIDSLTGWMHGWVELILYMPFVILPGIFLPLDGRLPLWLFLLTLFYLLGTTAVVLLRLTRRIWRLLYAVLTTGLLSVGMFGNGLAGWVTWVIGLILFYRGAHMANRKAVHIYPEMFYWLGPLAYFVTSIFYLKIEALSPYVPLMFWLGIAALLICIFMSNRVHLQWTALSRNKNQQEGEEQKLGSGIEWHNRLVLLMLLAIIALGSLWKQLKDGIAWLYEQLVAWLNALFASEAAEEPIDNGPPPPPDMSMPPGLDRGEPSALFLWLEKAAKFVFFIIMLIAFFALLYWLARKSVMLVRWLNRWLKERMGMRNLDSSENTGYTDEEENLEGGLKHWRRRSADRLQDWLRRLTEREVKWEALPNNREKARYLYRHYVLKQISEGYSFKPSNTPKETGRELDAPPASEGNTVQELVEAYEKARYGERDPEAEPLSRIRQRLRIK
ncbi:DUF4129 domain-containing protein [Paenibacillus sp. J2TS4]|uniref:DUF4129 domain-containing protein n=1 Tax=Paenibacillus sp. J2TS4 TaxID=2807194 RepID=UPI001B07B785|nr:DUF4129 domain-containing protein [Paenibacillus sp. J2TS4]GIP35731.1 hypothetical protein J2TS4_49410 [Paenibacillus sp. J2TS4]